MPTILGANSVTDTAFSVDNSIRLDGTDDHLSRTLTQNGTSQKAFTFSCWIKRSKRNSDVPRLMHMGGSSASPTHYFRINFRDDASGALQQYHEAGGSGFQLTTDAVFRDTTGWMHVVVAVNSAESTESDRQRIYINGVEITNFSSTTAMSQNADLNFNQTNDVIYLFRKQQDSDHFPGYACEVAFIDGQQLAPTAFGEFDEDSPTIWKPKDFKDDVTFGTNGFYLEFKDSSDLGTDTSGNGNDLNVYANNQSTDTCTNNFCTLNDLHTNTTISEGNLTCVTGTGTSQVAVGTFAPTQGKWYWEVKADDSTALMVGVADVTASLADSDFQASGGYYYYNSGQTYNNNNAVNYGDSWTDGDTIGVALDLDNNKIYFSKNGTFQNSGDPTSGSTGTGAAFTLTGQYYPALSNGSSSNSATAQMNFGSPAYSISSGNSDANGHGNFEYAVPSGYFALCTKNLAENG